MRIGLGLPCALFLVAWPAHADFNDATMTYRANVAGGKDGGIHWVDLNEDGRADLIVNTGSGSAASRILFWTGNGYDDVTATHAPGLLSNVTERSIIAADVNHDGYVDFARNSSARIELYLNKGPAANPPYSFGDATGGPNLLIDNNTISGLNSEFLGWLDYNGDGYLDLVADNHNGGIEMFENPADGSAAFVAVTTTGFPVGTAPGDYGAITDYDVDGDVDVLVRRDGNPDLWVNQGNGTFIASAFDLGAPNSNKGGAAFCDLDDDGDFDLFWTDGGSGSNQVFENSGGALVATNAPATVNGNIDGVACADVDHDGDLDLFLTSSAADQLFINDGNFSFTLDNRGITSAANGEAAQFADFDNDGDMDLIVNQDGDNALFENDTDGSDYLMVKVLADVAVCPNAPVHRTDVGATLTLSDENGAVTGVREINGGKGHGSQGYALAHFGLASSGGPNRSYDISISFRFGDEPDATLPVNPSQLGNYQLLEVVHNDPDGDNILTSDEIADTAMAGVSDDMDGDGYANWNDSDADGDGLLDADEAGDADRCSPADDTDGDGATNYLDLDSDDDDVDDGEEIVIGTDPLDPDSDDDGLLDGEEIDTYMTDPLDPDSDGGGVNDGDEVLIDMTDPNDPCDDVGGGGGPGCGSGGGGAGAASGTGGSGAAGGGAASASGGSSGSGLGADDDGLVSAIGGCGCGTRPLSGERRDDGQGAGLLMLLGAAMMMRRRWR